MRFKFTLCFLYAVAMLVPASSAQEAQHAQLRAKTEARLQEIIAGNEAIVGMVAYDLNGGARFAHNEDMVFPQGSAIKIPILMEVYKQSDAGKPAAAGKFKLTDRLPVTGQVGGSGVLEHLGRGTSELSVRDIAVLMILISDNTATNMLIELVGMDSVTRTMTSLGLEQTKLQRKMMDTEASARGDENLSTPAEAARLMDILYRGEFVSREACDDMLAILKIRKRGAINAALPGTVPVAFKPGGIPGVKTEWAVVYLEEHPYIVILMANYDVRGEASATFKEISGTLYDYYRRVAHSSKYGATIAPDNWN